MHGHGSRPSALASTSGARGGRGSRLRSPPPWGGHERSEVLMPVRSDLKKVMVIGAGPIVIGQACEFDYSGTQGCRALKSLGIQVVLLNSNPATIMTDPEFADRTYIEPLLPEIAERILEREKPDALLPTLGGQTGLNLAVQLARSGALERHGRPLARALVD